MAKLLMTLSRQFPMYNAWINEAAKVADVSQLLVQEAGVSRGKFLMLTFSGLYTVTAGDAALRNILIDRDKEKTPLFIIKATVIPPRKVNTSVQSFCITVRHYGH
jgi:hypothetical protein